MHFRNEKKERAQLMKNCQLVKDEKKYAFFLLDLKEIDF